MFPFWMPNQIAALTLWFICLATIPKLVMIPVRGRLWVCLVGWNYEAQIKPGSYLFFFLFDVYSGVSSSWWTRCDDFSQRWKLSGIPKFSTPNLPPLQWFPFSFWFDYHRPSSFEAKIVKNDYSSWLLLGVEIFGNPKKFYSLHTWCVVSAPCCFFFFLFLILLVLSSVIFLNCIKHIRRQDEQCYVSGKFQDSR